MGTRVTLIAERPGLVIGRKGGAIKALTDAVERKFNLDNPQIEVQEVANPALNAQIMAEKLANALERGWHFRRAGHSTVRRIMEAGARGCIVVIAGKLTGHRHRRQKFPAGHIKYCGEPRNTWMRTGFAIARMKPGVIGVTVRVMVPEAKLPDDITIKVLTPAEAGPAVVEAAETRTPPADATEETAAPARVEAGAEQPGSGLVAEEVTEKVKMSKVAEKKLKKVLKEVKEPGVEVDVDLKKGGKK